MQYFEISDNKNHFLFYFQASLILVVFKIPVSHLFARDFLHYYHNINLFYAVL